MSILYITTNVLMYLNSCKDLTEETEDISLVLTCPAWTALAPGALLLELVLVFCDILVYVKERHL